MQAIFSTFIPSWLFLLVSLASTSSPCPAPCQCKWQDGLNTIDCVEKNITKLPTSTDTIEAMVLDRNDFSMLEPYEFYNAKWSHVRKVSMKFCRLDSVKEYLFAGLTNLHYLDLSHNYLTYLPFQFPSLPVLRTLDLSHNLLHNIHIDTFSTLGPSLERIDMSHNSLTAIPSTTFTLLPKLRQLSLGDNPWHCDCKLGHLHSELTEKNILPLELSCFTPERLATLSWSSFHSSEFTCPPTVFQPDHQYVRPDDVLVYCQVTGNPTPIVTWRKDVQTIPQVGSDLYSIRQKSLNGVIYSVLTIRNMSRRPPLTLGLYYCVAKNVEGMDEKGLEIIYPESFLLKQHNIMVNIGQYEESEEIFVTPASTTAINTVGLPAIDISTAADVLPMMTSTPKAEPDLSPPPSRAHLDTIPEQE